VTVLLGGGDGTFHSGAAFGTATFDEGIGAWPLAVADFDKDGHHELVTTAHITYRDGNVTVLPARGDGTFATALFFGVGNSPFSAAVGDFNGDGMQDVVAANNGEDSVTVLLNQWDAPPLAIRIDVKPGNSSNSVNPRSRGVIPVAILGSETFDVAWVDLETVRFGPAGAEPAHSHPGHAQDVNLDGFTDLLIHFRTQDTGIACRDESATLTGVTTSGESFEGFDSLRTVGCREGRRRFRGAAEPE
jgi:hypothetical protein